MHIEIRRRLIYIAVLTIAIGGTARCTTYGGDGTEEALYRQIEVANDLFAQDLGRARAGVDRLRRVALRDPSAAAHAERYRAILQGHEAMLEVHRRRQERLSPDDGYRELYRVFGSIVIAHQVVRDRYQSFWRRVEGADMEDGGEARYIHQTASAAQYAFTPPYYERLTRGAEAIRGFGRPTTSAPATGDAAETGGEQLLDTELGPADDETAPGEEDEQSVPSGADPALPDSAQ